MNKSSPPRNSSTRRNGNRFEQRNPTMLTIAKRPRLFAKPLDQVCWSKGSRMLRRRSKCLSRCSSRRKSARQQNVRAILSAATSSNRRKRRHAVSLRRNVLASLSASGRTMRPALRRKSCCVRGPMLLLQRWRRKRWNSSNGCKTRRVCKGMRMRSWRRLWGRRLSRSQPAKQEHLAMPTSSSGLNLLRSCSHLRRLSSGLSRMTSHRCSHAQRDEPVTINQQALEQIGCQVSGVLACACTIALSK
mmetsp:Transcript_67350/g.161481  ORF Transcript_67350/g.161481 Transcript_67350/m.161481 type:complete len:246 (-) Transcript_67350:95-832(-)